MNAFSRNLVANLLGAGWTALIQFAAVPALIHLVGIESFALIGFYSSLVAILTILDLGLSPTLMRMIAGARIGAGRPERPADLVRTFELLFCAVGVLVGACIALAAPFIATQWLSTTSIAESELQNSIRLMGLLFTFRWAMAPYTAALQGLQRQVTLNTWNALMILAAQGGGIAMLLIVEPKIEVFFAWQCACAMVQLAVLRVLALRALPGASGIGRFRVDVLRGSWRFASGMTGITLTGIFLTQADKLILVKLVPLQEFGYYAVALTLATVLHIIIQPVFNTVLPKLCNCVGANDEIELRNSFDGATALMNAMLMPVGLFLILFPHEVLQLWIRDPGIVLRCAPLLALLATGTLLNGLMVIPYALQFARGNTAIGMTINAALCVLLVPAMLILTGRFGIAGGAAVSPLLNGLFLAAGLPATYRWCMGSMPWTAFYSLLIRQQGAAILLLVAARLALPTGGGPIAQPVALCGALAATLIASLGLSVAASPPTRAILRNLFQRGRSA